MESLLKIALNVPIYYFYLIIPVLQNALIKLTLILQ
jgi:hypothetical protein